MDQPRDIRAFLMAQPGFVFLLSLALPAALAQEPAAPAAAPIEATCIACHGQDGAGNAQQGYPRIAALPETYIAAQLRAYASGERISPIMQPLAKTLSAEQIQAVSHHYAQLPAPMPPAASAGPATMQQGRHLVEYGDWSRNIPACVQCHGPKLEGVGAAFPPLAGQHASYLRAQLTAYRTEQRRTDPLALMRGIAQPLSDAEIGAVAEYIASLNPVSIAALPAYVPPDERSIPDDKFGAMVRRGKAIFMNTPAHADEFVRARTSCVNCHLDRGRRALSAPMGPAFVTFPQYRKKNDQVNTLGDRIQGCFRFSEDGNPPPLDGDVMTALTSYFFWLSTGLPSNPDQGQDTSGFAELPQPPEAPSAQRGAVLYARNCALCHGPNGAGMQLGGQMLFPPLWGPQSSNWGAGIHRINTAASFIRSNMPLGKEDYLSLQQSWDVAAFVMAHERPQDPRYTGSVEDTQAQFHDHACFYGKPDPLGQQQILGDTGVPTPTQQQKQGATEDPQ